MEKMTISEQELTNKLSKMNAQEISDYFNSLSAEDKLKYSRKTDEGFYYLDFYLLHYIYIPTLDEWVHKATINGWIASHSTDKNIMYIPNHPDKFLIDIDEELILVRKFTGDEVGKGEVGDLKFSLYLLSLAFIVALVGFAITLSIILF